jgi:hypothetical protein
VGFNLESTSDEEGVEWYLVGDEGQLSRKKIEWEKFMIFSKNLG